MNEIPETTCFIRSYAIAVEWNCPVCGYLNSVPHATATYNERGEQIITSFCDLCDTKTRLVSE